MLYNMKIINLRYLPAAKKRIQFILNDKKSCPKASRATMRKNGRYLGDKRQYGWKVIGQGLVVVPHEQAVISKIEG